MKNANIIFTALAIILSFSLAYAQNNTGVKTKDPNGILHVDGQKDNSAAPTAAQQANDFIITPAGNIGIGNIFPTVKLLIDNDVAKTPAIKIVDGTQQTGRVLTSDANGVGTWADVPTFRATILGTFPPSTSSITVNANTNTGSANFVYSGVSIFLPQGKWAVNAGMTFGGVNTDIWHHCYLSSSQSPSGTTPDQTGFTHLGPAGTGTAYAGILIKTAKSSATDPNGTGFITGSSVINVTDPAGKTIYLLFERWTANVFNYNTNNYENYFYAVPVQ
ncbi:hypothetical protein [Pedobacter chitinilyticus]|uniref:Uncharacterized protein n=1 Tax=Pedobacter chitinilyticus TaxID=2233776 RepID=A0A443YXG7_9SPHI|nr:hypothetical protein [Pedobacter chitinilyticus]RWU08682.1 hypothetical protein DPV69_09965 [Pedobacter chitinilyticus]